MNPCADAVTLSTLADYFAADLPARESDALEEHLMACEECTERLEAIAGVVDGVRRLAAGGAFPFVLTPALSARLDRDGVPTRAFTLTPGSVVACGVAPHDTLIVLHLEADLAGSASARLSLADEARILAIDHEDIPLGDDAQRVSVAYPAALIRTLPDLVVQLRLTTGEGSERAVTAYTLQHSQAGPPSD